jgi:hypothetical protein
MGRERVESAPKSVADFDYCLNGTGGNLSGHSITIQNWTQDHRFDDAAAFMVNGLLRRRMRRRLHRCGGC